MPTIFVWDQAAELYLKSLRALNVYRGDTDDETPPGGQDSKTGGITSTG